MKFDVFSYNDFASFDNLLVKRRNVVALLGAHKPKIGSEAIEIVGEKLCGKVERNLGRVKLLQRLAGE